MESLEHKEIAIDKPRARSLVCRRVYKCKSQFYSVTVIAFMFHCQFHEIQKMLENSIDSSDRVGIPLQFC